MYVTGFPSKEFEVTTGTLRVFLDRFFELLNFDVIFLHCVFYAIDLFACDDTGATPLHYACMFRGKEFIKMVLNFLK